MWHKIRVNGQLFPRWSHLLNYLLKNIFVTVVWYKYSVCLSVCLSVFIWSETLYSTRTTVRTNARTCMHQWHKRGVVYGVDSMRPTIVCIRRIKLVVVCIPQGVRCVLPTDASVAPDRCILPMTPNDVSNHFFCFRGITSSNKFEIKIWCSSRYDKKIARSREKNVVRWWQ